MLIMKLIFLIVNNARESSHTRANTGRPHHGVEGFDRTDEAEGNVGPGGGGRDRRALQRDDGVGAETREVDVGREGPEEEARRSRPRAVCLVRGPVDLRQNAASKVSSPVRPTWYALTRRSKKFVSSCTSWSSMNSKGFRVP